MICKLLFTGICLIINNEDFNSSAVRLGKRCGTDVDAGNVLLNSIVIINYYDKVINVYSKMPFGNCLPV